MPKILNKTPKPLRINLPGNKTLHLAPNGAGQITDKAAESPSVLKLIEAGTISVEGAGGTGRVEGSESQPVHESTHGHPQPTVVMPKGNR